MGMVTFTTLMRKYDYFPRIFNIIHEYKMKYISKCKNNIVCFIISHAHSCLNDWMPVFIDSIVAIRVWLQRAGTCLSIEKHKYYQGKNITISSVK